MLIQLGLMPEYLPFPRAALQNGHAAKGEVNGASAPEKETEYKVPATGVDIARKMRDKDSVVSNEMFGWGLRAKQ